jgi:hypothetical protein
MRPRDILLTSIARSVRQLRKHPVACRYAQTRRHIADSRENVTATSERHVLNAAMATIAIAKPSRPSKPSANAQPDARPWPHLLPLVPSSRVLPFGHAARGPGLVNAVCIGCAQFLCAYSALHVAHAKGVDWRLVRAISSIPLFSIFIASLAIAAAGSVPTALAFRRAERRQPSLPVILVSSIGLFAVVVALFP